MEWIAVIAIVFILWYALRKPRGVVQKSGRPDATESRELRIFNENTQWMQQRWEEADREQAEGALTLVKPWHFDEVTKRQLARIDDIGLSIRGGKLTKGQASDIIGLYEPVEPENAEILRFFKVGLKGFNQSRARHEVARLLTDPRSKEAWEGRPATTWQKEFYRTFDFPVPKGLTQKLASEFIAAKENELLVTNEERFREWEEYETIYDELLDPDSRELYEIKKVSVKALREAVVSLLEDGNEMQELSDDVQLVVDRLIEKNPNLYREPT